MYICHLNSNKYTPLRLYDVNYTIILKKNQTSY
nr:MAG TPA: hypothetical protein [Caudoviricetes sp.]